MTLQPAYGRDYKSRATVLADLKAGKDFITASWNMPDKPINLPGILALGDETLNVRYNKLRMIAIFKRSELE